MTIDLYYTAGSGPCRAVLHTAKLLGLELNIKNLNLMEKEQLSPEFVKINPQHTVPTIVDDGFALWESNAIITYLVEKYGKDDSLYPKDPKERAIVNQRLYFNMGTLYDRFLAYYRPMFFGGGEADPAKFAKIEEAVKFLDVFLEGNKFVAGDQLTVADVAIAMSLSTVDAVDFDYSSCSNVASWYTRVQAAIPDYEAVSGKEVMKKLYEPFMANYKAK